MKVFPKYSFFSVLNAKRPHLVLTIGQNDVSVIQLAPEGAGKRERKKGKNTNHHRRAGYVGSRTMTFNRRKTKQIFYKLASEPKSMTVVPRR